MPILAFIMPIRRYKYKLPGQKSELDGGKQGRQMFAWVIRVFVCIMYMHRIRLV